MRKFDTGATRDLDNNKYDYADFFCPLVMERFAEYMHKNRIQADGTMRSGDNWKQGMPKKVYMQSAFRHFMDVWKEHEGIETEAGMEENITAVLFNMMGYLHEILEEKRQEEQCYGDAEDSWFDRNIPDLKLIFDNCEETIKFKPSLFFPDSPDTYVVEPGDTLWGIAGKVIHNPKRWPEIWRNNKKITNPNLIYPGEVINLAGLRTEENKENQDVKTNPTHAGEVPTSPGPVWLLTATVQDEYHTVLNCPGDYFVGCQNGTITWVDRGKLVREGYPPRPSL